VPLGMARFRPEHSRGTTPNASAARGTASRQSREVLRGQGDPGVVTRVRPPVSFVDEPISRVETEHFWLLLVHTH
jgi:hypothetical protein